MDFRLNISKFITDVRANPLEYLTMILAMLGATFAADVDASIRGLGFFIWIFSNGYMMWGFYRMKNLPYFIVFLYYEYQNFRGVINNW